MFIKWCFFAVYVVTNGTDDPHVPMGTFRLSLHLFLKTVKKSLIF
jgi:hypothetical protein